MSNNKFNKPSKMTCPIHKCELVPGEINDDNKFYCEKCEKECFIENKLFTLDGWSSLIKNGYNNNDKLT